MSLPEGRPPSAPQRRRHSPEFKAKVLAECDAPGASVASVAIRHGLNPNMVHSWRRAGITASRSADFIRLPAPAEHTSAASPILVKLEVPTPKGTLIVHWPLESMSQSITWLRALTR